MRLKKILGGKFKENDLTDAGKKACHVAILRSYLEDVLPSRKGLNLSSGEIILYNDLNEMLVKNASEDQEKEKRVFDDEHLIYNVTNDEWMLKRFKKIITEKIRRDRKTMRTVNKINKLAQKKFPGSKFDFELDNKYVTLLDRSRHSEITDEEIAEFIAKDPYYDKARFEYQEGIMYAQAGFMMKADQPNYLLVDPEISGEGTFACQKSLYYHPRLSRFTKDTDLKFRDALVNVGHKLHFNEAAIQSGVEKSRDLWFDTLIMDAYYNKYLVNQNIDDNSPLINGWYRETIHENLQGVFKKVREYEYYERNKDAVDKFGTKTKAMKMNKIEAEMYKAQIRRLDGHFLAYQKLLEIEKQNNALEPQAPLSIKGNDDLGLI